LKNTKFSFSRGSTHIKPRAKQKWEKGIIGKEIKI
jgi:hypothetical protein